MGSNTLTNHGAKIPMPNPNLVEAPMHCSWCGEMLPLCECPASLARSIDKERAEAIRERNELQAQLDPFVKHRKAFMAACTVGAAALVEGYGAMHERYRSGGAEKLRFLHDCLVAIPEK